MDKWHLDEVVVTIKGEQFYLWRAVDMQRQRNKVAAKKFFLKSTGGAPRAIVTDKMRSYGAAKQELMPAVEHRQNRGLNNRAENSCRPTSPRERRMGRFKYSGGANDSCLYVSQSEVTFIPIPINTPRAIIEQITA